MQADDGDFADLLAELRVLLPGTQLLTAFLITLPFSAGFAKIVQFEKWVFAATFVCSLSSLVFFSAPAVQHRLLRPLKDRARFKELATRLTILGCIALALALVLGAYLVLAEVFGPALGMAAAGMALVLIVSVWALLPLAWKAKGDV